MRDGTMPTYTGRTIVSAGLIGAVALAGCTDMEMEVGELGSEQASISGGSPANNSAVYKPVVHFGIGCSGTKIGARRFLTAAHCIDGGTMNVGDTIDLTNDNGGLSGGGTIHSLTVTSVNWHPSWELSTDRKRAYDIGVFTVAETTPAIPTAVVGSTYVGDVDGQIMAVGFGCDAVTPSQGGTKQYAMFWPSWRSYWFDTLPYSTDWETGMITHNILAWTDDSDDTCPGDSGGPQFRWQNSRWEIVGVNAANWSSGVLDPFNIAPRTSNTRNWIFNPTVNNFSHDSRGSLINAKSGKCAGISGNSTKNGAVGGLYYCDGRNGNSDNQSWRLVSRGGGWYQLRNGRSGRCLSSRSPGWGDGVAQFTCDSSDQFQQWKFENNTDGVFRVRNRYWNTCLGVSGGKTNNGALLGVWSCSGTGRSVNQSWVLAR